MEWLKKFNLRPRDGRPVGINKNGERTDEQTDLDLRDIAKEIRNLPPPAPVASVKPDDTAGQFTVFLAATSDSQWRMSRRLAEELKAKGIHLADAIPPPEDVEAHDERALAELQRASVSVHLLDEGQGKEMLGADNRYYPERQIELAQAHITSPMIWVPRGLKVAEIKNERQRAYLEKLEAAPRQADSYNYLLYDDVGDIVREVLAKQEEFAQALAAASAGTAALLDAHVRDMSHAVELFDARLSQRNVPLKTNWGNDDPRKNLNELAAGLKLSSHLILVFGQTPRDWVVSRLREAVKICVEDDFRLKPCGIYFAPPHHLGEGTFDFGNLPVTQFDSATLNQALPHLLAQ